MYWRCVTRAQQTHRIQSVLSPALNASYALAFPYEIGSITRVVSSEVRFGPGHIYNPFLMLS